MPQPRTHRVTLPELVTLTAALLLPMASPRHRASSVSSARALIALGVSSSLAAKDNDSPHTDAPRSPAFSDGMCTWHMYRRRPPLSIRACRAGTATLSIVEAGAKAFYS